MRYPALDELVGDDHRFLWEHDAVELHAGTSTATRVAYEVRLKAVVAAVETHGRRGLMLDVACAQGNIALSLAAKGWPAVGVDLRYDFLTYAMLKTEDERVSWVAGSIEALPLRDRSAEAVVLGEIVEHVAYPERLLAEARRVTRPGGIVIATTPNGGFVRTLVGSLATVADRQQIETRQFEPDADGHLFLMTKEELIVLGTGAGLAFVDHQYFQTPPITGWPRSQRFAARAPVAARLRAERMILARKTLARRLSFGQLAVFRRPR